MRILGSTSTGGTVSTGGALPGSTSSGGNAGATRTAGDGFDGGAGGVRLLPIPLAVTPQGIVVPDPPPGTGGKGGSGKGKGAARRNPPPILVTPDADGILVPSLPGRTG